MEALLILLLLGGIGLGVYLYIENAGENKDVVRTTLPAAQVIRQAIQEVGSERKWMAVGHGPDYATLQVKRRASCLLALFLAVFWILPGIIYMIWGGRNQSLTVNVFPEPDGTKSIHVSSSGGEAKRRGRRFLSGIPKQPSLTPQQADALPSAAPGGAALPMPPLAATEPLPASEAAPQELPATQATASLPQKASASDTPTESEPAGKVFCQDCGTSMEASHRFCPSCGTEQPAT